MEIKIFRANHGEGKTEWLVERAIEARANGYELIYVGGNIEAINKMWMAKMHEMCPAKPVYRVFECKMNNADKYCFLTDNLMENLSYVTAWHTLMKNTYGVWYVTMCDEDFVN